jgi:hypothetical protein
VFVSGKLAIIPLVGNAQTAPPARFVHTRNKMND